MRRGTTPTITLKVKDASVDLTELQEIYVTFSQSGRKITKKTGDAGFETESGCVHVTLTQAETLYFRPGTVDVQLRALTPTGNAVASNAVRAPVSDVLLKEVISCDER